MLTFPSAHDILLVHSLPACKQLNTKMLYLSHTPRRTSTAQTCEARRQAGSSTSIWSWATDFRTPPSASPHLPSQPCSIAPSRAAASCYGLPNRIPRSSSPPDTFPSVLEVNHEGQSQEAVQGKLEHRARPRGHVRLLSGSVVQDSLQGGRRVSGASRGVPARAVEMNQYDGLVADGSTVVRER